MSYTPPTAGASSWDVPLNAALAAIDADAAAAQATADDALAGGGATVATQQDTTSTTYADLTTAGPSVTVTLNQARTVVVLMKAALFQVSTTDAVFMSFAASGATTVAASDDRAVRQNGAGNSEAFSAIAVIACAAGTTTFTAKYRAAGGTGRFSARELAVIVT